MIKQSNKTINFLGGPEKRIRHRLGLGRIKSIKLDDLLEIAKILGYTVEFCDYESCDLGSDSYYTIYTGFSKLAIYVISYDIAQDADGFVTDIFEVRGEYADYGLGNLLSWIFKYKQMKALSEIDLVVEKRIGFPNNREKRIRKLLGLAERRQFSRDQVLTLANMHGYKERYCDQNNANQFSVYPKTTEGLALRHHFQLTVDEDDLIQSIVIRNAA